MGGRRPPAPPQLVAPKGITSGLPLSKTFDIFTGQQTQIPQLAQFADIVNLDYVTRLESGLPGTISASNQVSNLVNQLLSGQPPADVQAQTQRYIAQQSMMAGLPATSGMARNLQARDFGQTSLDLMMTGAAMTPDLMQLSSFLSPQQVQNYLFSTGQIRGEQLKESQDRANVQNQNAINKYNYDVAQARSQGGFLGSIGGLVGGIAGSLIAPGIGTALGASIGGGLGSLAGGGGFQLGAGQAGGLVGAMGGLGTSLFGGGLVGGGGGLLGVPNMTMQPTTASSTMFSPTGSAFTMPTSSFGQPFMNPNWTAGIIGNIPDYGFGGSGMLSTRRP